MTEEKVMSIMDEAAKQNASVKIITRNSKGVKDTYFVANIKSDYKAECFNYYSCGLSLKIYSLHWRTDGGVIVKSQMLIEFATIEDVKLYSYDKKNDNFVKICLH